jgi:hypothetical protein
MLNILADTLADKNRGLSPVYDNLIAPYCQTPFAHDFWRYLSEHIGRQKQGKCRVYVLHYNRRDDIPIGRTK